MSHIPNVNTFKELETLPGKAIPVSIYAMLVHRHRHTIYARIERGTLPACNMGGLLCVVVLPSATKNADNSQAQ